MGQTQDQRMQRFAGGCFCGQLRYVAAGAPSVTGHCYCTDCQKVSGSGFIPFMSFPASAIGFQGRARQLVSPAARGGNTTRNFCPDCGSLVFGGEMGKSEAFTVYAGSLDDTSLFEPRIALFESARPHWALLPPSITTVFARMPGDNSGSSNVNGRGLKTV